MSSQTEIEALRQRIAQAQRRCMRLRIAASRGLSGGEERYLAAFCTVEALELQLEIWLQHRGGTAAPDRPLAGPELGDERPIGHAP